jgi:retinol-binding protein 3
MSVRLCLIVMLCLLGVHVLAAAQVTTVPDTPAGRALSSWLDAFNSGDRALIDSYDKAHFPVLDTDRAMRFRSDTGGFELLGIEKITGTQVIFHVRRRTGPNEEIGLLILSDSDPSVIATLRFFPMPPGAKYEEITLDAAARNRIISAAARLLDESYVFPDVAKKMTSALRANEKRGEYKSIVDGTVFAVTLTEDLQDVSHDPHLELRFSPVAQPSDQPAKHPEPDLILRRQMMGTNCGFERAEHLPPNIGYLKFNMFADPAICAPTAIAALNFVADSDALILDLRNNNGGSGEMVALIASYLFDQPTHLNDSYDRSASSTRESWTLAYVPGKRFIQKPVFVLTSRGTFSAAEDFSYALKKLKRATLIGESTGGGAHMVQQHRLDDHFTLVVPFARSISPITKSDWEGTGVEPDVKVPAAEALTEALTRARN